MHTNSQGKYRFSALREGSYVVRAKKSANETSFGPFLLAKNESKTVNLTLVAIQASGSQSASQPEFFEKPEFTVSGVSDTTNLGGHGSGTTKRTSEALSKQVVSLGKSPTGTSSAVSVAVGMEKSLLEAAEQHPGDFQANSRLGQFLLARGESGDAIVYLERAFAVNAADYPNAYARALAYCRAGKYEIARRSARALLSEHDTAEVHHLLADTEEKAGNSLEAVLGYEQAAKLNPSEPNLFDWAAELLMHDAFEPAVIVFDKGHRLYPHSTRMLVGLGVAWYARGEYDRAANYLCQASKLDPGDPTPYLFLGKIQAVATTASEAIGQTLARFARLQPKNALANYYYALSLWKQRRSPANKGKDAPIESLLENAVQLDPKLGPAYVQLGVLYSERGDFPKAISSYKKAIDATPELEEAHYRLGQAYIHVGDTSKGHAEIQLYKKISKRRADELARERHDFQRFVYRLREPNPTSGRQ
jgi:tetratricopeptide (TPR) repeat protein